jgi:hypothetical protein
VLPTVSFKAFKEGEKKYSPPRGMTKAGMGSTVAGLLGSVPVNFLSPWPIIGSNLFKVLLAISRMDINYTNEPRNLRRFLTNGELGIVRPA